MAHAIAAHMFVFASGSISLVLFGLSLSLSLSLYIYIYMSIYLNSCFHMRDQSLADICDPRPVSRDSPHAYIFAPLFIDPLCMLAQQELVGISCAIVVGTWFPRSLAGLRKTRAWFRLGAPISMRLWPTPTSRSMRITMRWAKPQRL